MSRLSSIIIILAGEGADAFAFSAEVYGVYVAAVEETYFLLSSIAVIVVRSIDPKYIIPVVKIVVTHGESRLFFTSGPYCKCRGSPCVTTLFTTEEAKTRFVFVLSSS